MNDRGLYSCNLHHIYCHLHETVRVQLNVTKSSMDLCQTDSRFTAVLRRKSPLWCLVFSPRRTQAAALLGRTESGVRGAEGDHRRVALHEQAQRLDGLERRGGGPAGEWINKAHIDLLLLLLLCYCIPLTAGCVTCPGCPLGPSVPGSPAWQCRSAGGSVRLWRAAQLRASVPAEEDEHQQ